MCSGVQSLPLLSDSNLWLFCHLPVQPAFDLPLQTATPVGLGSWLLDRGAYRAEKSTWWRRVSCGPALESAFVAVENRREIVVKGVSGENGLALWFSERERVLWGSKANML